MPGLRDRFHLNRPRWRLATLLAFVAILAVGLAVLRPLMTPAAVRAAEKQLRGVYMNGQPVDPHNFNVSSIRKSADGQFWEVSFTGKGRVPSSSTVIVPEQEVRKYRLIPW